MRKESYSSQLKVNRNESRTCIRWRCGAPLLLSLFVIGLLPLYSFGQPIASGKSKFLGNVIRNGNAIRQDFDDYWNQVTPEDAGKWESVEGSQDIYNWSELDNIYNYALNHNFPYKHHALVWGQQYPSWITSLDSASQRAQVEEWIDSVGTRYPNMDFVDVVNEPFNAPPPFRDALGGSGKTGWDWVITAFQWAREYCAPGVKLLLNEYNVLHSDTTTDNFLELIDTLKVRGLIDGIGIQGHYFEFKSYAGSGNPYAYPIATIENNLNRLTATGLPVYITEFDINEADDTIQLDNYKIYFPLFWENPGVKGITLWGYVEGETWKPNAYLIDWRGQERPSLLWLRNYVISPPVPQPIWPNVVVNVPRNPTLLWHSSDSANSYHLQLASNSVFVTIVVDTVISDTSLQLNPLDANRAYYWHVNASNSLGTSEFCETASFMTGDFILGIGESEKIPEEFRLYQNHPNPFNPQTTIRYYLPEHAFVNLTVYDIAGRLVRNLASQNQKAGRQEVIWDGRDNTGRQAASGVFIYRLKTDKFTAVKKMILMK